MRKRDLTEIIGRRDAIAVGRALARNWSDWGRVERAEATATTYVERQRRLQSRLARYGLHVTGAEAFA